MKSDAPVNSYSFKVHKSYSPEEVLAAGGPTAFGIKNGKNNQKLIEALEKASKIEFFTDEEWDKLLSELENDK